MTKKKLLVGDDDDDASSGAHGLTLEVNKEFAQEYEKKKRAEEIGRLRDS
jgi:hypothetical protein